MIQVFRESILLKPAEESFRQGWGEALRGETRPVSDLWEDIDAEWIGKRGSGQFHP